MCVLYASTIKTRHDYAFSRMSGSGGHEFSDKHRRNVQARELSERHAAKRKAEGKPVQSSALKKQKSLFGLSNFSLTSKKRQKTSETQATTTSTSNSEVANSNGGDEGGKMSATEKVLSFNLMPPVMLMLIRPRRHACHHVITEIVITALVSFQLRG